MLTVVLLNAFKLALMLVGKINKVIEAVSIPQTLI